MELDHGVPQASTIGRFRIAFEKSGRLKAVLGEINSQFSSRNLFLQEDRIAIVAATANEASQSGIRTGDPKVGSHIKINAKGKTQEKWGFKAFANIVKAGFIFAMALTLGNEHESKSLTRLLDGSETCCLQTLRIIHKSPQMDG